MRSLSGWRGAALIVCATAAVAFFLFRPHVNLLAERISVTLMPSAERAFAYGVKHFDAREPDVYNVEAAEWFYRKAFSIEPDLFYLRHELARIAFLKGDFEEAMEHINAHIDLYGNRAPNSYYIRGLIEGYMGAYDDSIADYALFLAYEPGNWAAINDYAWVLLKAGKNREAVVATAGGLALFPDNPWLLNTNAIALYEIGLYEAAYEQALKAIRAVSTVTEHQWLVAYPGNDPRVAAEGVIALQDAAIRNMHTIRLALQEVAIQ
jgi:tetratricopeptide (TPR) repeat protein